MNHIVDRSRDGEVSNFFPGLWEKPSSSSPSLLCLGETSPVRFQSATISAKHTTQTLHWQDKGSRIEGQSLLGERLFQKEECEIVWESCFSSLNVPFRKFDKPGPTFHSLILDKPSLIFFLSFQFVHEHENGSPLSQSSSSLSSSINQAQSPTTSSLQRCYASSFFFARIM